MCNSAATGSAAAAESASATGSAAAAGSVTDSVTDSVTGSVTDSMTVSVTGSVTDSMTVSVTGSVTGSVTVSVTVSVTSDCISDCIGLLSWRMKLQGQVDSCVEQLLGVRFWFSVEWKGMPADVTSPYSSCEHTNSDAQRDMV